MNYLEGRGHDLIEVRCRNLPGETKDNHDNSDSTADVPTEIRIDHLLNTRQERYHYANLYAGLHTKLSQGVHDTSVCSSLIY
jgi:hypothetical protein